MLHLAIWHHELRLGRPKNKSPSNHYTLLNVHKLNHTLSLFCLASCWEDKHGKLCVYSEVLEETQIKNESNYHLMIVIKQINYSPPGGGFIEAAYSRPELNCKNIAGTNYNNFIMLVTFPHYWFYLQAQFFGIFCNFGHQYSQRLGVSYLCLH